MNISKDVVVRIHYRLTDGGGTTIDSSEEGAPLAYLHGHGNLVQGLEAALEGRTAGDTFSVQVPPEEGYGVRDPELDLAIPLEAFPQDSRDQLVGGARFQGPHPTEEGQAAFFLIIKVEDGHVLCTANHPLADMTLHFDIEVVDLREATEDEIAQGRVDLPGEG